MGRLLLRLVKGGSLETVRPFGVDNPTGILFDKQDIGSVIDAVKSLKLCRIKFFLMIVVLMR